MMLMLTRATLIRVDACRRFATLRADIAAATLIVAAIIRYASLIRLIFLLVDTARAAPAHYFRYDDSQRFAYSCCDDAHATPFIRYARCRYAPARCRALLLLMPMSEMSRDMIRVVYAALRHC